MVDYMTILKGAQGIGKSSAIRILFGEDHVLEYIRGNAEGKDAMMAMAKAWVVSDEELGMQSRTEMNKLKAFLTVRRDVWRAPYAADTLDRPRAFVVWGSTNSSNFLTNDPSGYRRYAVVEVARVDFKGLHLVREQLFAEAAELYRSKKCAYSTIKEASVVASDYVTEDSLMGQVEHLLEGYISGSGKDHRIKWLGAECHGVRLHDVGQMLGWDYRVYMQEAHGRRLSEIMRALGWARIRQQRVSWDQGKGPLWVRAVPKGK